MLEFFNTKRINPVIDTNVYAAGDQIGPGSTALGETVWGEGGTSRLISLSVIDKAKQKAAIDLVFFNSAPTVASADNAAFDVTDAEMAAKFVGVISVAAGDYKDIANSSIASLQGLDLFLKALKNTANPGGKGLWVSLVSRGTPTYTSTSDLVITLNFR